MSSPETAIRFWDMGPGTDVGLSILLIDGAEGFVVVEVAEIEDNEGKFKFAVAMFGSLQEKQWNFEK